MTIDPINGTGTLELLRKLESERQKLLTELRGRLTGLHKEFGYSSTQELIRALQETLVEPNKIDEVLKAAAPDGKGSIAPVSDEVRREVIFCLLSGDSPAKIREKLGVSSGTVYRFKHMIDGTKPKKRGEK